MVNYDRDSLQMMGCLLWLNGYDSELADGVQLAERLLGSNSYSLLVCRNAMPDGDGPSLIKYAWERFAIPAIAVTGTLTAEQMAARVVPDALRGVLVLPATQKQLLMAVAKALGRSDVGPHHRQYSDYAGRTCPDCKGTGQVLLLVNRKPCVTCGGDGRIATSLVDLSLRHVNLLPPPIRFALYRRGIATVREAGRLTESELCEILNLTASAAAEVRDVIREAIATS